MEIGSGRGGGASFVAQYHNPSHMTGLDYSTKAVKLSINLHKEVHNLQFVQGDAESLPFDDKSFDVTKIGNHLDAKEFNARFPEFKDQADYMKNYFMPKFQPQLLRMHEEADKKKGVA